MSEFVSLPQGAVGWSAISDGGISLSYSLIFRGRKSCLYPGDGLVKFFVMCIDITLQCLNAKI